MNIIDETLTVPVSESLELEGHLFIPENCIGIVLFAHGSGSSRYSVRNNFVAEVLLKKNIGTFLFDLLSLEEDLVYSNRFDTELLSKRLSVVARWLSKQEEADDLPLAYFGASTGTASALFSAAKLGSFIKGIVSRGGRPDLAMPVLDQIKSPVLFMVGSLDHQVIKLNHEAYKKLKSAKEMTVIPGASHLFGEPGKLDVVAEISADWFTQIFKLE
jgi:putative phosphoribosyl transferase